MSSMSKTETTMICDRCGTVATIKGNAELAKVLGKSNPHLFVKTLDARSHRDWSRFQTPEPDLNMGVKTWTFDLCPTCREAFHIWIGDVKEKTA